MAASVIYRLKIRLLEIEPPIWRQFEVTGSVTLSALHLILQNVMGWEHAHLYLFHVNGKAYEPPELEGRGHDARRVRLEQLDLSPGDTFDYIYDMGDDWQHELLVEGVAKAEPRRTYPSCLAGARACPPEDCGGIPGYANLLDGLAHPRDPEAREILEWVGPGYDPDAFDLRATNRALRLARSRRAR
jgi:hypothetical protein